MMAKICIQCQRSFDIRDKDLAFYEMMQVPLPVRCHLCLRQQLLCWRNPRTLYGRTCAATNKPIISIFAPQSKYVVYDRDYWWSDAWDPFKYGQSLDFSKTFAEQYDALLHRVPLPAVINGKTENSQYSNHTGMAKSCYLTFASWEVENVHYSDMTLKSKDCMDVLEVSEVENSYELIGCNNVYNLKFAIECERCTDSWFLYDCKDCLNCIGCTNLRNKQYYIFNKPYSKEAYEKMKGELNLHTRSGLEKARLRFMELKERALYRFAKQINAENSSGNNISNVKNCDNCFAVRDAENCSYCINGALNMRDTYDGYGVGAQLERSYCCFDTGDKGMENLFTGTVWGSSYAYYCYNCFSCFEIFGCIGLRGKSNCILNKAYSKEEYDQLKKRLIEHMKETGEWGYLLPARISPFGYNETVSVEYQPLSKADALAQGFNWQDQLPGTFGKETLMPVQLPETMAEVNDAIEKEILACINCKKNYKIVPQELAFYRKHALPVPSKCPDCRYAARVALRQPHQLWPRQCGCTNRAKHAHGAGDCPNTFETTYSPNRSEAVYCETCYQAEVG